MVLPGSTRKGDIGQPKRSVREGLIDATTSTSILLLEGGRGDPRVLPTAPPVYVLGTCVTPGWSTVQGHAASPVLGVVSPWRAGRSPCYGQGGLWAGPSGKEQSPIFAFELTLHEDRDSGHAVAGKTRSRLHNGQQSRASCIDYVGPACRIRLTDRVGPDHFQVSRSLEEKDVSLTCQLAENPTHWSRPPLRNAFTIRRPRREPAKSLSPLTFGV